MKQEKKLQVKLQVKRDIARFYLTGKFTLKSIMKKYGMTSNFKMQKILHEVIEEINHKKINQLF